MYCNCNILECKENDYSAINQKFRGTWKTVNTQKLFLEVPFSSLKLGDTVPDWKETISISIYNKHLTSVAKSLLSSKQYKTFHISRGYFASIMHKCILYSELHLKLKCWLSDIKLFQFCWKSKPPYFSNIWPAYLPASNPYPRVRHSKISNIFSSLPQI